MDWSPRWIVAPLAIALGAAIVGCGQTVGGGPGSSPAATRASAPASAGIASPSTAPSASRVPPSAPASTGTASPSTAPSASQVPPLNPTQLTATNCSGPTPTTPPRSLGNYFAVRIASSWTDTGDYAHTETLLLELTAPSGYGYGPTRLQFHSLLGPVHLVYGSQATSHTIAEQHAASIAQDLASPNAVASAVSDCVIGGRPAAVFGYSNGSQVGFRVYVVDNDLLFLIWLNGTGGIGEPAVQDAVAMVGSITWTS
jgi:hypothetical protein